MFPPEIGCSEPLIRKISMTRRMIRLVALGLTISMAAGLAKAGPIVTFYDDEAKFLAALSHPTVLDFEGIVPDDGLKDFGPSYHAGSVTFTSPAQPFPNDMLVVGKDSQTLGAPFDSAVLISSTDPAEIVATFDPGSNVTAVGGFFLSTFGTFQVDGTLTLVGSTGLLDQRSELLGIASIGEPKTFFGYTVSGDTISSLSVNTYVGTTAFQNFVYAAAVPEPSSLALICIAVGSMMAVVRVRRLRGSPE